MTLVLYAIIAYLLFQLIFRLVIPLYMASRTIKKGFREMKSRMEDQSGPQQTGFSNEKPKPGPAKREKAGDYIDFEEVK